MNKKNVYDINSGVLSLDIKFAGEIKEGNSLKTNRRIFS